MEQNKVHNRKIGGIGMKEWLQLYNDEISEAGGIFQYYQNKVSSKKKLIKIIMKHLPSNGSVLEAGCGTGVLATYLATQGFSSYGIDNEIQMINLAKMVAKEISSTMKPCFEVKSIFDLSYSENYFDLIFSSGVLEHFSDSKIIETLSKQLYCARYVVVLIPTQYFDSSEAMHGDERFLPLKKWHQLISESGGRIIKEASCHYLKLPYRLLRIRKIFRGWPYRIFLIESK